MAVKRILLGLTLITSSSVESAFADTAAGGSAPGSFLLGPIMLLVVLACLLTAFKVHAAIRGGKLSRGWMWFMAGFGILGAGQLWLFLGQIGLTPVWAVWIDLLRIAALTVMLVGVTRIRQSLA